MDKKQADWSRLKGKINALSIAVAMLKSHGANLKSSELRKMLKKMGNYCLELAEDLRK